MRRLAAVAATALSALAGPAIAVETAYTDLDLQECAVLSEDPGREIAMRCAGLGAVPVFVTEGDLRFDVDFGVPDDRFDTFSPFNALGSRVEWRVEDGEPFAAILRFRIDPPTMEFHTPSVGSVLGIFKVGEAGSPGCPIGYIDATANEGANETAQQIADAYARAFRCGVDRATYIGARGALSGDATATLPPR